MEFAYFLPINDFLQGECSSKEFEKCKSFDFVNNMSLVLHILYIQGPTFGGNLNYN